MVRFIVVKKTLNQLKTKYLQQLAREYDLKTNHMSRDQIIQVLLYHPWLTIRGGGRHPIADLPEPALVKMFETMSQADIKRLRIASKELDSRLKQLESAGKMFFKEKILSRPPTIIRKEPILEAINDKNAHIITGKLYSRWIWSKEIDDKNFPDLMRNVQKNPAIKVVSVEGAGLRNCKGLNEVTDDHLLYVDLNNNEIEGNDENIDTIINFLMT